MSEGTDLRPGFLPLSAAAVWAGVSGRTMKRWIARGLPCYQAVARGKVLVKPEDIEAFLTKRQEPKPNLDEMVRDVMEELQRDQI